MLLTSAWINPLYSIWLRLSPPLHFLLLRYPSAHRKPRVEWLESRRFCYAELIDILYHCGRLPIWTPELLHCLLVDGAFVCRICRACLLPYLVKDIRLLASNELPFKLFSKWLDWLALLNLNTLAYKRQWGDRVPCTICCTVAWQSAWQEAP